MHARRRGLAHIAEGEATGPGDDVYVIGGRVVPEHHAGVGHITHHERLVGIEREPLGPFACRVDPSNRDDAVDVQIDGHRCMDGVAIVIDTAGLFVDPAFGGSHAESARHRRCRGRS